MVAMRVGDDRTVDRLPRVYVKVAGLTIEAAIGASEQGHGALYL
jgi:hypothetical protein